MNNILGPNGTPVSTSKKTPTQSIEERRRIVEMCQAFSVPGFEDDLINAGLSSAEAWDRLVYCNAKVAEMEAKSFPRVTRRHGRRHSG